MDQQIDTITKEVMLLEAVFKSSLDAKLLIAKSNKIIKANPAAEKIFGKVNHDSIVGESIYQLVSRSSWKRIQTINNKLKKVDSIHQEIKLKIGREILYFDLIASANVIDNINLFIFRDITERVREREARQQFIAVAGHEIKTPLAVIMAYTELLKRKFKNEKVAEKYLNKIIEKNKVLTDYVEAIVDESKIGTGKFDYNDEIVDFDQLVYAVTRELSNVYNNYNIVTRGKTQTQIKVDKQRIIQVIQNMIVNAVKYSPKKTRVRIIIKKLPKRIYLAVQDQGKGVRLSEQAHIFKAFYRSKSLNKINRPGLGLGLFIANTIIRHYGGKMGVHSKIGKGATFYFELPLTSH